MKLQNIIDDTSSSLMTSKQEADQASESIDFYTDLEVLEEEIPRVQVTNIIYYTPIVKVPLFLCFIGREHIT